MDTKPHTKQNDHSQESEPFVPPETPDFVPLAEPPPGKPEAIDKDLAPKPDERE